MSYYFAWPCSCLFNNTMQTIRQLLMRVEISNGWLTANVRRTSQLSCQLQILGPKSSKKLKKKKKRKRPMCGGLHNCNGSKSCSAFATVQKDIGPKSRRLVNHCTTIWFNASNKLVDFFKSSHLSTRIHLLPIMRHKQMFWYFLQTMRFLVFALCSFCRLAALIDGILETRVLRFGFGD